MAAKPSILWRNEHERNQTRICFFRSLGRFDCRYFRRRDAGRRENRRLDDPELPLQISTAIGSALALYGRLKATAEINGWFK